MACVVCAEGECSPDCIFVDVFPADNEESKINAEKVLSGWHVNHVKELLIQAKVRGGVDLMKALVKNWIGKYQITRYYKRNKAEENAKRETKRMLEKIVADLKKVKGDVEKRAAYLKKKTEKNRNLLARQKAYLQIQRAVYDQLTNPVAASAPGSGSSSADNARLRIQRMVYDQLTKLVAAPADNDDDLQIQRFVYDKLTKLVAAPADNDDDLQIQRLVYDKLVAASAPGSGSSSARAPALADHDDDLN